MALPEVGTLYIPFTPVLPYPFTQPGGAGTVVYPQAKDSAPGQFETPLTPSGQYVFGCNHPMNCPRIWEVYDDVNDEQAALVCCPTCGFIQEIIEPYSQFQNYISTPIIIA